jgi:hypothetical protein
MVLRKTTQNTRKVKENGVIMPLAIVKTKLSVGKAENV